jgi:uncharacterized protein (DUF488 family)
MIGHSNHSENRFLELLKSHEIAVLIDIRSSARSRFARFNKNALNTRLAEHGVEYRHMPELGGRNPLPDRDLAFELKRLLPSPKRTCFLCSEGDFHVCHRHSLIAPIVRPLGCAVLQILPSGSVEEDV